LTETWDSHISISLDISSQNSYADFCFIKRRAERGQASVMVFGVTAALPGGSLRKADNYWPNSVSR
jgi:hypothetical protein